MAKGAKAKWCRGIVAELPLGNALFYMHSFISLSEIYGERSEGETTSRPNCTIAVSTASLIIARYDIFTRKNPNFIYC